MQTLVIDDKVKSVKETLSQNRKNMENNEINDLFEEAINLDVIDEMDKSQLEALLTVLDKVL